MSIESTKGAEKWCFFDVDGVLVYECGVAYAGYWLQLEALRTGTVPDDYARFLEIPNDVKHQVDSLRPHVKGLHFSKKLEKIHARLSEAGESVADYVSLDSATLVKAVMEVQRAYIQHHFPPEDYRVPGSEELLRALSKKFSICTLTANDYEQTSWILQYVGLTAYFSELLCYRADAPDLQTKEDLLKDFRTRHPSVDFTQCVVLGDGAPDIRAGVSMGCFTVGICREPDDRVKLAQANLLVATGEYSTVSTHLLTYISPADSSELVFVPHTCGQPCEPDADCIAEFSCQQKVAPPEVSVCIIWDVAYNEIETPLEDVRGSTRDGSDGSEAIYRIRIPLASMPRSTVTNVGMIVLRNGPTIVHKQLFRVAYVAENAVALQML